MLNRDRGETLPTVLIVLVVVPSLIATAMVLVREADAAIPGDPLYGADIMIEDLTDAIGVGGSHAAERFAEAEALARRSQPRLALETAWAGARAAMSEDWAGPVQMALLTLSDPAVSTEAVGDRIGVIAQAARAGALGASSAEVAEAIGRPAPAATGHDPEPPGLDDTFVAPGRDDAFTPPGHDDGSLPPGRDPAFIPPGQSDNPGHFGEAGDAANTHRPDPAERDNTANPRKDKGSSNQKASSQNNGAKKNSGGNDR